jgi:hypothetical protein
MRSHKKLLLILLAIGALGVAAFVAIRPSHSDAGSPSTGNKRPNCKIGRRPTLQLPHILTGMGTVIAGPVVVGCGKSNGESIEIAATLTSKQICVSVDRLRQESIEGGECKPREEAWSDRCGHLCIYSVLPADLGKDGHLRRAVVSGQAVPDGTNVSTFVSEKDGRRRLQTVNARVVSPALLKRLHQEEPFFVFAAILPTCVAPRAVLVSAVNSAGELETVRGQNVIANACRAPRLPKPPSKSRSG